MQVLKRILFQVVNLGLEHTDSELQKLRRKSINVFNVCCILALVIINSRIIISRGVDTNAYWDTSENFTT